jgi:hypothetical protein
MRKQGVKAGQDGRKRFWYSQHIVLMGGRERGSSHPILLQSHPIAQNG